MSQGSLAVLSCGCRITTPGSLAQLSSSWCEFWLPCPSLFSSSYYLHSEEYMVMICGFWSSADQSPTISGFPILCRIFANLILEAFLMSWQPSWCLRRFLYVINVLAELLMLWQLSWCLGHLLDVMSPLLMYWQPSWCPWKPWQTCVLDFQCLLLLDVMFLSWCYYYLHCLSLVDCRYWTYYRHTMDILWDTMGYYGHTIGGLTVAIGAR